MKLDRKKSLKNKFLLSFSSINLFLASCPSLAYGSEMNSGGEDSFLTFIIAFGVCSVATSIAYKNVVNGNISFEDLNSLEDPFDTSLFPKINVK